MYVSDRNIVWLCGKKVLLVPHWVDIQNIDYLQPATFPQSCYGYSVEFSFLLYSFNGSVKHGFKISYKLSCWWVFLEDLVLKLIKIPFV